MYLPWDKFDGTTSMDYPAGATVVDPLVGWEAQYPALVQAVKEKVAAADAVIIVTPEYNRSVSGVLKNAIDWISRPYGTNPFAHKPVLIMGVSSGKIGTAIAQSHLRETLEYLDADTVGQPELYLGPAKELFTDELVLREDSTKELLKKALAALAHRKARRV